MPAITPFLWFNDKAEAAANFYVSIFPNSKILSISRYGDAGPGAKGSVMTVNFELDGRQFTALNGGPRYSFTPSVSFLIPCETQQEVDHYWDKLTSGGKPIQCGWLEDKYGLSWQIVPTELFRLVQDKDPATSQRVMKAMLQMVKLDVSRLQQAANESEIAARPVGL
jgi:predicted 3-demethylubiquinone-9 3-methyltransferase (glyoxalase superfamily)